MMTAANRIFNMITTAISHTSREKALWSLARRLCYISLLQTKACWKTTRGLIGGAIPFKVVNDASQFVAPIFINLLLSVVDNNEPSGKGYFLAVLMFVGLMLGTICDNQHFQFTMRAGE